MGVFSFKGGVHPDDCKRMSMDKPIEYVLPKGDLVYPMQQHLGAPCKPIVKKGDRVLVGQKIGETDAFVSAYIHSSVSGVVKDIAPVLVSSGNKVEAVIVENDGLYEEHDSIKPRDSYENLSKDEIRAIIKDAGIVGMGGAGFPTHIKLTPPADKKIDYIIVNGAECEPYLTSDYRVMMEEPDRIVIGLKIILRLFDDAKGIIAIEDNKPEAIKKLKELCKNEDRIEVKVLKTKYPQGAEKQLVSATTGRTFTSKSIPIDVGCVVQNIDTVVAVHRAVLRGRPLMRRIVTVTGSAIKDPKNIKVRIGTNLNEVIEAAGGFTSEPGKIIAGGPMMGMALFSTDIPVTKGVSAVICMAKEDVKEDRELNCIRCGKCVEVCPNKLLPLKLAQIANRNDEDAFVALKGMECCECGSCSYICPSKKHIAQAIKTTRREILSKRKKK